jgi:hypothetical protein
MVRGQPLKGATSMKDFFNLCLGAIAGCVLMLAAVELSQALGVLL